MAVSSWLAVPFGTTTAQNTVSWQPTVTLVSDRVYIVLIWHLALGRRENDTQIPLDTHHAFSSAFSFLFPFFFSSTRDSWTNRYDGYDVTRLRGYNHMSSSRAHQDMIHNWCFTLCGRQCLLENTLGALSQASTLIKLEWFMDAGEGRVEKKPSANCRERWYGSEASYLVSCRKSLQFIICSSFVTWHCACLNCSSWSIQRDLLQL